MKQYEVGCAIVRIHGSADREKLEKSTANFLKKVERKKRENGNTNRKTVTV